MGDEHDMNYTAQKSNYFGGLIGCGHPVGASGARMFVDLYKQVTGKAGRYQVVGARNGMMLNVGGCATTNYVFIVGVLKNYEMNKNTPPLICRNVLLIVLNIK